MSGTRSLLTGASGFVGTQVRAFLPKGIDLHGVSRTPPDDTTGLTWHAADLRDPTAAERLVRDLRPDTLIHCAWETRHGHFWEAESNNDWRAAGQALFRAFVAGGGRRIVATGTCAEYTSSDAPLVETAETGPPATRYGRAKQALLHDLATLPVSWAWVRVFNAYGPGEDPRRFIPSVAQALAEGRMAACSSGRQIRDFIDVRDLGRAIADLSHMSFEGAINIGSGTPLPLGEVATELGRIAGRPDLIGLGDLPDRPGEPPCLIPDLTRQAAFGFQPALPLTTGLKDAWMWWQDRVFNPEHQL